LITTAARQKKCIHSGSSGAAHTPDLSWIFREGAGGDQDLRGSVVVPLPRLPRALLAPLRATTSRIATLLAAHPAEPM
jgi:hypothetical protein